MQSFKIVYVERLQEQEWQALRDAHHAAVDVWISPRLERRARQELHPIDDFLFDYYPISANKLRTWHPGINYQLIASDEVAEYFPANQYDFDGETIQVSREWLESKHGRLQELHNFLTQVNSRPAKFGCFGLHEWAMVLGVDEVRHQLWPLRVSQDVIRATIHEQGLRCTHFDAFRFFTDEARPLNPLQLVRSDQAQCDQGGCLHANMDLYKYAFELAPIVGSSVVRSAFELAKDIRDVDMQAAPYDLADLGLKPIKIETPEGRAEFVVRQREFNERAAKIRDLLLNKIQEQMAIR